MLKFLGKKKLSEGKLANMFANAIIDMVDQGFPEVAGLINDDPNFVAAPRISEKDHDQFMMIVVAGNISILPEYFNSPQDKRLTNLIIEKFSKVFSMEADELLRVINDYIKFLEEVNEPSLNKLHGLAKGIFYKYKLNEYQEEHFKKMNAPSPVFLLRLSDIMSHFMWSWETLLKQYKITAG